jgi:hypothetical protein
LLEGCPDRGDSAYYTFSLEGFAPCWPLDFTRSWPVEFKLNCMAFTSSYDINVTSSSKATKLQDAQP